jgi:MoaA/NifB/PqqE/SkfB family radical SAM enzyme
LKEKTLKERKPDSWWYKLPRYLAKITDQVAFSSGEPLLFPDFVKEFSTRCAKYGIITNITTNGTLISKFTDKELLDMLKNITMVSISYDNWKIQVPNDEMRFIANVKRLNELGIRVGVNFLLNKEYLKNIEERIKDLFVIGAERVFILHPKPKSLLGIKNLKPYINRIRKLMTRYPHLYVDDYIKMVDRYGYDNWKESCHYGKNTLSVGCDASISGCSFAKPEFYIDEPKDILKTIDYKFERKTKCVM